MLPLFSLGGGHGMTAWHKTPLREKAPHPKSHTHTALEGSPVNKAGAVHGPVSPPVAHAGRARLEGGGASLGEVKMGGTQKGLIVIWGMALSNFLLLSSVAIDLQPFILDERFSAQECLNWRPSTKISVGFTPKLHRSDLINLHGQAKS